ncbi:ABC transporter ATP-binding protein [Motiliproteus sp. SC1-56]|uniref:ATP-binding cassette domain-containing protein n=1 Tax=Motiliproteus sp. SC1-56 TaxID=2799565 RepID=UPI001A8F9465|nr:ABC transporter ATP-binding protein [Motiliproteus sp. SC1-56]
MTRPSASLPRILTGPRRWRFARLVANGLAQALVAVAMALLVKQFFDQALNPNGSTSAWPPALLGALTLVGLSVTALLRWRGHLDAERLGQGYVHAVRLHLFRHLTRVGPEGLRHFSGGAVMLRFVGDLSAIRNWVSLGLARLTVSGLTLGVSLLLLAAVEPLVALAVVVAAGCACLLSLTLGPLLRDRTRQVRRARGRLAANLNDRISHLNVIQAFGQQEREQRRFKRHSREVRDRLVERARVVGLLRGLTEASASLAGLCALLVGAGLVQQGSSTPGSVVAAMLISGLLTPRLQDLGRVYEYWNGFLIAREKQLKLLQTRPPLAPAAATETATAAGGKPQAHLRLDNVHYAPAGLKRVSSQVQQGSKVAILGPNGAGKSSLLRLIAGLVPPSKGSITLNDSCVEQITAEQGTRRFALVSPDLPLLRGSLRYNLTYGIGSPPRDDCQLNETIDRCGLAELVSRLPRGLEQRISERQSGLSKGERARIALARALLAEPEVLLLDEADANLDAASRNALARAINDFPGTVLYATHDAGQARKADCIWLLHAGGFAVQGNWEEVQEHWTGIRLLHNCPKFSII